MTVVGTITSAWRYPVKSMAGEALETANVTLQGIQADRMYAFVQAGSQSPFPWLTGRELPSMLYYRPSWTEGERPGVEVLTPSGDRWPVASDELRAELERESGRPVFLLPNYRGSFDVAALTFISGATINRIAEASGTPPEPKRFRMSFYVDTDSGEPFAEDQWVGKVLRVGDNLRVAITERDKRCVMITLPQGEGGNAPEVLRAAADLNEAMAGVYGSVLTPGQVRPGDTIRIE